MKGRSLLHTVVVNLATMRSINVRQSLPSPVTSLLVVPLDQGLLKRQQNVFISLFGQLNMCVHHLWLVTAEPKIQQRGNSLTCLHWRWLTIITNTLTMSVRKSTSLMYADHWFTRKVNFISPFHGHFAFVLSVCLSVSLFVCED